MGDGSPRVTPVWVDTHGSRILVNTAQGRQKGSRGPLAGTAGFRATPWSEGVACGVKPPWLGRLSHRRGWGILK